MITIIIDFLSLFQFQVFTVRSGGAVGVVVKGPSEKDTITFRYGLYLWVDFDDAVYSGFFPHMFMILIKSWFKLNLGKYIHI